jgi:hypothetical protein
LTLIPTVFVREERESLVAPPGGFAFPMEAQLGRISQQVSGVPPAFSNPSRDFLRSRPGECRRDWTFDLLAISKGDVDRGERGRVPRRLAVKVVQPLELERSQ